MTPPAHVRLLLGISIPIILAVPAAGLLLSAGPTPPTVDLWWRSAIVASRTEPLTKLAHVLDAWGAGGLGFGVVPAAIIALFILTRRVRAVPGFLGAGALSLALVRTLKPILDRARPDDMLTISDVGSFPSGHVTNVATLCVFAALVYRKPWISVIAIGYIVLMAWSRTYLSAHWLTDTIAGAFWGAALAAIVFSAASVIADRHAQRPPSITDRDSRPSRTPPCESRRRIPSADDTGTDGHRKPTPLVLARTDRCTAIHKPVLPLAESLPLRSTSGTCQTNPIGRCLQRAALVSWTPTSCFRHRDDRQRATIRR